jgi:DNA helicase-2/ATP-dependent DNA helicase PcrA
VFLVGLEDGVFPHSRSLSEEKELEEERRLAYVAITRAERMLYVTHAMHRRTYGVEFASEPSQFLNELPLELIEDLSPGASWLSYARSAGTLQAKAAASALRGEAEPPKPRNVYTGKTYNSADAVAEFFKNKATGSSGTPPSGTHPSTGSPRPTAYDRLKAAGSQGRPTQKVSMPENSLVPGTYVRHEKYGRGLILRREGSGDNVKLTISFPGFGQKKLIEKFANLEKDQT